MLVVGLLGQSKTPVPVPIYSGNERGSYAFREQPSIVR